MALSVSYRMGTKISLSDTHRPDSGMGPWGDTVNMQLYRLWGNTTERSARSCAPDRDGSPETFNIGFHGTAEGADIDQVVQKIQRPPKKALLGQSFLGKGILCWHHWPWCRDDWEICKASRAKRTIYRTAGIRAINTQRRHNSSGPPPQGAGPTPPYGGTLKPCPLGRVFYCLAYSCLEGYFYCITTKIYRTIISSRCHQNIRIF